MFQVRNIGELHQLADITTLGQAEKEDKKKTNEKMDGDLKLTKSGVKVEQDT